MGDQHQDQDNRRRRTNRKASDARQKINYDSSGSDAGTPAAHKGPMTFERFKEMKEADEDAGYRKNDSEASSSIF